MKISKILAGMSAAAIAATLMASTAFATSTVTPSAAVTDEWASCFPDGDYVDAASLTKDQELTMTINFKWTDTGTEANFCAVKPAFANGWEGFFKNNADKITTDMPCKDDLTQDSDTGEWKDAGGNVQTTAYQPDGFVQAFDTNVTSFTFTLSADLVNDIIDTSTYGEGGKDGEDGSKWDGILCQIGNNGMEITSIDFSQDGVMMHSAMPTEGDGSTTDSNTSATESKSESKTDSTGSAASTTSSKAAASTAATSKAGGTTTTTTTASSTAAASDNTAETGATAGLALAGIALAGAAIVVSKRK